MSKIPQSGEISGKIGDLTVFFHWSIGHPIIILAEAVFAILPSFLFKKKVYFASFFSIGLFFGINMLNMMFSMNENYPLFYLKILMFSTIGSIVFGVILQFFDDFLKEKSIRNKFDRNKSLYLSYLERKKHDK